jgi:hypothetical protein
LISASKVRRRKLLPCVWRLSAAAIVATTAATFPATATEEDHSEDHSVGAKKWHPNFTNPAGSEWTLHLDKVHVFGLTIGSFTGPRLPSLTSTARNPVWTTNQDIRPWLCLGSACSSALLGNPKEQDPGKLVVAGLGPLGAKAISIFATPPPKAGDTVVARFGPLFAARGLGLQLHGVW